LVLRVKFVPDNLVANVAAGTSLRQAAAMAGIELKSTCGGEGTCGLCLCRVVEGREAVREAEGNISPRRKREGYILSCRTLVQGDLTVEIPDFARLAQHRVLVERIRSGEVLAEAEADLLGRFGLDPLLRRLTVNLEPPTLTENGSDWTRLQVALRREAGLGDLTIGGDLELLGRLPDALRRGGWEVTVWLRGWDDALAARGDVPVACGDTRTTFSDAPAQVTVVDIVPGRATEPELGVAIDIGTTSVVAYLVDLGSGETVAARGASNHQAYYGDDVITRIIHASESPDGLGQLQGAVIQSINELLGGLTVASGLSSASIRTVVVSGNTTMEHLFLGLSPVNIRLEPYIPAAVEFPIVTAGELGLQVNPAALVRCVPSVASYVGGDITAGVLATGLAESDEITLFIDIGTNGEMVLGNRDWMVSCSCSAGPCFEGGGIAHGMRAAPGAIERLEIDSGYEVRVETVGGAEPKGICGSGLVDALAKLREVGIIDRAGKFQNVDTPRLRQGPEGPEFVLYRPAPPAGQGASAVSGEIVISEADVKNLIRAKGAIYAGIRSLLAAVNLDLGVVKRIDIAGGFGNYLNVRDAIRIGMLPDVDGPRYRFAGNTSVKGAKAALLSRKAFETCRRLASKMTYLELSAGRGFMEEFVSALFLPHTDLAQFPSVPE
jgi:uncharacterized 2Fe-2S/4Fe-4S cluster protein (DUF4445 family)